jgi:hypothetical protein
VSAPESKPFNAHGIVHVVLRNISFESVTDVFANETFFKQIEFGQVIILPCLLSGIKEANVVELLTSAMVEELKIATMTGNSPLTLKFDVFLNQIGSLVLQNYGQFIPPLIDSFLGSNARKELNTVIWNYVFSGNGSAQCGFVSLDQNDGQLNSVALTVSVSVWGAVAVVSSVAIILITRAEGGYESLAFQKGFSLATKVLVPLGCIICLSINNITAMSTSAILVIRLIFGEKTLTSDSLYSINLSSSVESAWNAGVYQMAIVLVLAQVVLPYGKLVLMLLCWFIPHKSLSWRKKLNLLLCLDFVGRFQLISAFILVIYSLAFHFVIGTSPSSPSVTFGPQASTFESFVVVHADFWMFMCATALSMVLTTFMVHLTRNSRNPRRKVESSSSKRIGLVLFYIVLVLVLVNLGLLIAGLIVQAFELHFVGLGGYILSLVGNPATRGYSLIDLAESLREGWLDPAAAGAFALQSFFFVFAIILPCLQLSLALILWIKPQFPHRKMVFFAFEVVCTWASLDVFLVSVLASVVSLERYGRFIIGDHCAEINRFLQRWTPKGLSDDRCMDVFASLDTGVYLLITSVLLAIVLSRIVIFYCHHQFFDMDCVDFDDAKQAQSLLLN